MDLYKASLENIPETLILEIFSYLSRKKLCQIARVCKQWHRISNDNKLNWLHVDITPDDLKHERMWTFLRSHYSEVLQSVKLRSEITPDEKKKGMHQVNLPTAVLEDLHGSFPNLRTLWLHNCNLYPVNLALLPSSLHTLDLNGSDLHQDYWFKPIETGSLKYLKVLKLSGTPISIIDVEHISKLAALEVLHLDDSYWFINDVQGWTTISVADDALKVVAEKLTRLTELRINGTECTNLALHHISRNLKNLKLLDMSENCRLSDAAVGSVASGLKNLVHLDISGCEKFTDAAVNSVANNLKQLEVFHFCKTNTTCEPVKSFFKKMPKLRDIEMGEIDDKGLESLVPLGLVSLKVGITDVSDEGLIQLYKLKNLKNLTLCHLSGKGCSITMLKGQKIPDQFILPFVRDEKNFKETLKKL